MSFELKPGDCKTLSVAASQKVIDAYETAKQLLNSVAPAYEKVVIYNHTKTAKIEVRFNGVNTLVIEVTNEEEDSKFRIQE